MGLIHVMMEVLVGVNGVYDVVCGLWPGRSPHKDMFVEIDERALRYLGYWVAGAGAIRLASAVLHHLEFAALTYLIEAIVFAHEHLVHKNMVAWRVAFVCVSSLALAALTI